MAHSSAVNGLDFKLDRASEIPLGTQLAWRLRALIASGALAAGGRLPGVREMATAAGVNVNTVRSVYARLADQGLIVSEHGRGTFVAERLPDRDELSRLAEEAAEHARAAGIDPRELAAAVFAIRADAPAEPAARSAATPAASPAHRFGPEPRRRSALRTEIAGLERELAALEVPGDVPDEHDQAHAGRSRRPTPQLLTVTELERIRDDLDERLQRLRADRTLARADRKRERLEPAEPERRHRAIGTDAPQIVSGAGGWSFRWRG